MVCYLAISFLFLFFWMPYESEFLSFLHGFLFELIANQSYSSYLNLIVIVNAESLKFGGEMCSVHLLKRQEATIFTLRYLTFGNRIPDLNWLALLLRPFLFFFSPFGLDLNLHMPVLLLIVYWFLNIKGLEYFDLYSDHPEWCAFFFYREWIVSIGTVRVQGSTHEIVGIGWLGAVWIMLVLFDIL